jgi:hypothetical protein
MLGNTYTITVGDLSAQITLDDTSTSSTGNSKGGGMQQSFDQNMRQNPGNNGSDGSNVDNGSNGGNGGPDNSDTSL